MARSRPSRSRRLARRLVDEAGSSPVTAVGSVVMFLLFLLLVVQATIHLFATSRAGAVALEAAGRGARADDTQPCVAATTWADDHLAGWDDLRVSCRRVGQTVEVRVRGPSPAPALAAFGLATGLDTLDRRAAVRRERVR